MVSELEKESDIDRSYYDKMVDEAVESISKYGDFEWFASDNQYIKRNEDVPPWLMPCGDWKYTTCFDCPSFHNDDFHMDCRLGYDLSTIISNEQINTKSKGELL